ncbi:MAG TPA: minichromosome maintenance protein MCM [Candidatus Thermoplasmatota archaeon]|nr:minichromosome maintenance protein MCM [Candidatus Thermoplasmatota archaeon]
MAMAQQVLDTSREALVKNWETFLKKYCRAKVNEAALAYPQKRSIVVSYWDLHKHDPDLAEFTLENPTQSLSAAEEAVKTVDTPLDKPPKLHVRVEHLPDHATVEVRSLRAEHMGRMVAIQGLVKKVTEVRPKLEDAVFQCQRCGAFIREPQEEHLVLKEPSECYEDQGGCARQTNFKLMIGDPTKGQSSRFVDTQKVEIQESPEKMRGGEQPQRLVVFVEDDLCGETAPGDRIVANGILRASVRKQGGVKSTILDIHLDVISVEREQHEFEEVQITPEEEEEILRFSRDPELYQKFTGSIAPDLYGLEVEKLTLLLQLFGGLEKKLPSGGRLRGDIHVLLVGDPGVAKSQLVRYMSRLAPRGIYTSGKSSSGAGLTAAAVKDEFGDGRWTLEAGAMVLADRGLLCVDEIDKMTKEDQSSMHEGMEQQSISVAKAGITATLQSRCSVLGAANPKMGRFEEFTPITEQINFPPALLSRFDVIFVLLDKPEPKRDMMLAGHILEVHRGGAIHELLKNRPDGGGYTEDDVKGALKNVEPPLKNDFIRKYVAYCKRTCFPVLTREALDKIRDYYVNLRRRGQQEEGGTVPLTARQLEAFVRLAEAGARVRLSNEVTEGDAERAIQIVEYYLKRLSGSEGGGIMDIDLVASGVSKNQRDRVRIVKEIVKDLSAGQDVGAPLAEIIAAAESKGLDVDKVRDILKKLATNGELFEPRGDFFRVARN